MTDHRQLAVDLFNHRRSLLDNKQRTSEQDEEMAHSAHASRHHWGIAGTAKNKAWGEWQIARVYAVLKRFVSSAHHAQLCMIACRLQSFDDWDVPFAHEELARALVEEDPKQSTKLLAEARQLGENIKKDEDKQWLHDNLDETALMMDAH